MIEAWQNDRVEEPYIVGAHINLGLCLNFTDYGVMSEMKKAYKLVKAAAASAGIDLPKNETLRGNQIYLKRSLDCLVIENVTQPERLWVKQPMTQFSAFSKKVSGFTKIQVCVSIRTFRLLFATWKLSLPVFE